MQQMNFRDELAKLTPRLRDGNPGKIYVFGIGWQWSGIYEWYKNAVNVDLTDYIYAFVDNDQAKQGTMFMGKPVIAPAKLDLENAVVLISSSKYEFEIIQQLQKLGLIHHSNFFDLSFFSYILMRFVYAETSKFNNIVQGGRCFVIGNGPSLSIDDLDILHKNNEVTFAVNNIVDVFDKINWRPTYYFIHDLGSIHKINTIYQMKCPKFMSLHCSRKEFFDENTFYYILDTDPLNYDFPYRPKFSSNIEHMYVGGSVTYVIIQAVISMGFDKIYLLGLDHKFDTEVLHDGTIINHNVKRHFYKDKQLIKASAMDILNTSFKCAKEYADSHNIKIHNATRGGALEIFERVDFDSLFG